MAQVGNKNIDNASGQVVRLDIQNTLQAIATNNFGARNNGGTILPCEFLADDTTNKLLIRGSSGGDQANPSSGSAATFFEVGNLDQANLGLLPKAGGTMTGQLLGKDGSSANSPAYAFDNDIDTGMFKKGANEIGFSTDGFERFSVDSAGITLQNRRHVRFSESASNGTNYIGLKAPSSVGANVTFNLPGSDGSAGQFLQTDGSGNLSFSIVAGVPSGSVFCMAVATVPSGYLECNGAAVSRTTYAALFAVIGVQYGAGNGSSTFNIPDLRGEFIRGFDNGKGTDNNRQIASSQGASNASHNHSISASGTTSTKSLTGSVNVISESFSGFGGSATGVFTKKGGFNGGGTPGDPDSNNRGGFDMDASHNHTVTVSGTTGSQGSEARPRNIAMMYVIKF